MKALFSLLLLAASFSAQAQMTEGTSMYVVESRTVVIQGQSAVDLYMALNDKKIEDAGNNTGVKEKNNVRCVGTLTDAKDLSIVNDAICTIRLSASTAINE